MMKRLFAVLLFASALAGSHAQTRAVVSPVPKAEARVRRIGEEFIAAYNRQDFGAMRRHFSPIIRVLLWGRTWKAHWRQQYDSLGPLDLRAGDVLASANGSLRIPLRYMSDTLVRRSVTMYVSPRGRVQGYGMHTDQYAIRAWHAPSGGLAAAADSVLARAFPKGFNGAVILAEGARPVLRKSWGYADAARQVPLTDSSVFNLASLSKQFTADAILKAQELGLLNVDDTLTKFFSELRGYPGVRIRHLVHHTGGLPT